MSTVIQIDTHKHAQQREAFMAQMLDSVNGYFTVVTIYLGVRMGFYRVLANGQALTSRELAARTDTSERYVREWLEEQTLAAILVVDDEAAAALQRRYSLPASHAEVLSDRESVSYLAPLAQAAVGVARPLTAIKNAIRTGGGVPFAEYGEDLLRGVAELNRPLFLHQLGQEYLPLITDIHRRLRADPPARVADMGCGTGWSSIGMALSYPKIRVDGFDLDEVSILDARHNAEQAGLQERVRFENRDAADPALTGQYDLVTAFECIHDMSDPVSALANMRRLAGPSGNVIVMDKRANEEFRADKNPIEHFLYGISILGCLPVAMAETPSAATGTVMRSGTLRQYALEAGFTTSKPCPSKTTFSGSTV
jgi:2-polyprenyl-3-methyl-5-hydroxy-6-metoxy-1,4-benzoquinol methylase